MARSALTLEGFWKASYSGSPWAGTASAGGSSGRNLTEATNPPSTGTAVNGLTPADHDGVNDVLTGAALTTYFTVSAWSIWILVYVDNVGTNANGEGELVGDSLGTFCLGTFNSSGDKIAVQQYDSSWKTVSTALTKSKWTLVQAKYDGTNMKIRTDGGSWSSVAVGSNANMTGNLRLGASRAAFSHFFDGKVLEVGCAKTALTDGDFDTIWSEIQTDYGVGPAKITAAVGTFTLSGQAVAFKVSLPVGTGSFALSGQAAGLTAQRKLTASVGSFAVTGQSVALRATRVLPASVGTFTESGQTIALRAARALVAGGGTFSLAGQDVTFGDAMPAATGTFAVTGQAVGFVVHRRLSADCGTFALSGQDVALTSSTSPPLPVVAVGGGGLPRPGRTIQIPTERLPEPVPARAYTLSAETGYFDLTGQDVELSRTVAAIPDPVPAVTAPVVAAKPRRKRLAKAKHYTLSAGGGSVALTGFPISTHRVTLKVEREVVVERVVVEVPVPGAPHAPDRTAWRLEARNRALAARGRRGA